MSSRIAVLCLGFAFATSALPVHSAPAQRPVLVQGALEMETSGLVKRLDNRSMERIGAWTFWRGTIAGYPVIVSKTRMGTSHAAAATALAIQRYHPIAIINQRTD